ncbi:MAG TPA: hypothetical protein VEU51_05525 [Candidatus Acidoferrales bacterium]|nr:hypothetical protein [Candidatus Acidoferrales bacterium]
MIPNNARLASDLSILDPVVRLWIEQIDGEGFPMRSRRDHMGTSFEVWAGQWTWFWCLLNTHRNGGAIGAAATEAEAVHEACHAIEEISATRIASAASSCALVHADCG